MGLARSTYYYDEPEVRPIDEARLAEQIKAVCAEWPAYGYRRVGALRSRLSAWAGWQRDGRRRLGQGRPQRVHCSPIEYRRSFGIFYAIDSVA